MQKQISSFTRKAGIAKGNILRPITRYYLNKRLLNKDFTMVSSNCIGSKFYQELGFPYNTPFVGMFIYAPCFIKLLGDLELYLKSDISFVKKSKYYDLLPPESRDRHYPIGVLNGDVEIQFLHYADEDEVRSKWTRRIQRMNMKNVFVTFTDRDLCNENLLDQFDQTSYEHKICFTARKYPSLKSSLFVSEYQDQPHVGDLYTEFHNLRKHFDFVDWLNGGTGRKAR